MPGIQNERGLGPSPGCGIHVWFLLTRGLSSGHGFQLRKKEDKMWLGYKAVDNCFIMDDCMAPVMTSEGGTIGISECSRPMGRMVLPSRRMIFKWSHLRVLWRSSPP
jgi:hypothetical protein